MSSFGNKEFLASKGTVGQVAARIGSLAQWTSASTSRTALCQYIPNSGGLQYLKTSCPEESSMSKQTESPSVVARWWPPSANTSRFVPWPAALA
jgi:hypothetical protein